MRKRRFTLLIIAALITASTSAQPETDIRHKPDDRKKMTEFVINVNPMKDEKRMKLNKMASHYRSGQNKSVMSRFFVPMLSGGVQSVVDVIGNEIISLTKIRSAQKKKWEEMRNKECIFIDSLKSVKGQEDFYKDLSSYGALDPTNMNFDGITFSAYRNEQMVLKMVCHIDTTRLNHMFMHSKFYLVLDHLEFYPFNSYLPNLSANNILAPTIKKDKNGKKEYSMAEEQMEYWNTISQFSFEEYGEQNINLKMEFFSSWITETITVHSDVKLGEFSLTIPINKDCITNDIYIYDREKAIANNEKTIDMTGDCFVVPRSFMPVSATTPSYGTGEYSIKVTMSQKGRYNPQGERARNWHKDYKQLLRMSKGNDVKNEYLQNILTTFRDNGSSILKATYTPLLSSGITMLGLTSSKSGAMVPGGGQQQAGGQQAGGGKPQ